MLLFGLGPTIFLHYIYVNMLRMCSFTYHRGNLLTNRNGDRQTFVGIRKQFRDRSRGFAIFEIYIFLKFVILLLHLGEYPNAALSGRKSLRIWKTDTH